ncbi:hypothetical protein Tco_0707631 [Tanacetum coccineum]|uniref:Uncharacterized protein n=1 Tax=Tanacetum coccineum TaxID=301880 RepID=A0ABQ4YAS0_9ASTR
MANSVIIIFISSDLTKSPWQTQNQANFYHPMKTTKPTGDVSPPGNTKKQSPPDLDTGGATDEKDDGDAADALAEYVVARETKRERV